MRDVNDQLLSAADVIDKVFGRKLPDNARETVNHMAHLALRYPKVWEVFRSFIDANLSGEVKPERMQ